MVISSIFSISAVPVWINSNNQFPIEFYNEYALTTKHGTQHVVLFYEPIDRRYKQPATDIQFHITIVPVRILATHVFSPWSFEFQQVSTDV